MGKRFSIWFGRIVTSVALVVSTLDVEAHDYWLEPDHFQIQPGQEVRLGLFLGQDFLAEREQVLQADRTPELRLYASPRRWEDLLEPDRLGKTPVAILTLAKPGTWLVGMDRNRGVISFGREKFLEYARHEGLEPSLQDLPAEQKSVRECYQRSLKTLLQCGGKMSPIATRPIEQPLQIVLTVNPYQSPLPRKVGCKILFQGQPLAGCLVTALHRVGGKTTGETGTTNRRGHVAFAVEPTGRWLIRCVHLEPAPANHPLDANWQSWWTALTFGYD